MANVRNFFGTAVVAVLLLGGLMASCSSDKNEELPVVCISNGFDNIRPVMLSEVATDIRYIPLETSDKCLVGSASAKFDFEVKPERGFFVPAMRSIVGVHYFDSDGKYVRPLGKKGRAKGEFIFNTNVVLSHDRDEIAIGSPQKTVIYSLEDEFLRELAYDTLAKHAPFIASLSYLGNGRYANMCAFPMEETGNPNVYMATFGDSGKMDGLYPIMEETVSVMGVDDGTGFVKKNFVSLGLNYTLNGEAVYTRIAEDTLFKFDENFKLVPFMALDYGKYKDAEWKNQLRIEQGGDAIRQINSKLLFKIRGPKGFFKGAVKSTMADIWSVALMVYDMKTSQTTIVATNADMGILGLENDIDGGAPFFPQVVEGNKMYQILDAMTFMDIAQKSSSAKMKEVAASLTEDSNPVIVEATIRQ